MVISTANIFTSIVLIVILSGALMGSSFGAGLNEKNKESTGYKVSVSFAGISASLIVLISLFIIFKAVVSSDSGASRSSFGMLNQESKDIGRSSFSLNQDYD